MATELEDLRVLQLAETLGDETWQQVITWNAFARDVVGGQLARAADSIGANIAEAYGRFHYGEKINHLYYARGSLFETKFWLNRSQSRGLLSPNLVREYIGRLTTIARQINTFASHLKIQRSDSTKPNRIVREPATAYITIPDEPELIFTDADLEWLQSSVSNLQSPVRKT